MELFIPLVLCPLSVEYPREGETPTGLSESWNQGIKESISHAAINVWESSQFLLNYWGVITLLLLLLLLLIYYYY